MNMAMTAEKLNDLVPEKYQVMPALTDEEYAELKADIAARGVMVPVEYDEFGNIIDGYHRVQICRELGIKEWPRVIRAGMTEAEKLFHARKLNCARRHLNQEQKRELIKDQLAETPEKSDRQIAVGLGVNHETVGAARKELESIGEIPQCDRQTSDGRTYPSDRKTPVSIFAPTARAQDKAQQVIVAAYSGDEKAEKLVGKIANGSTTTAAAVRQVKTQIKKNEQREKADARKSISDTGKKPVLICAPAEKLPLSEEMVDIIITSPPYNLGTESWPMGGDGRTPRDGIGYSDCMPEDKYQAWQVAVLRELYRVAKPGASFFYNHKVRQKNGTIIHPMDWLRNKDNPWIVRQEIIWDRKSTHNHCPTLFWPIDERIYWMTKGNPVLPAQPIGLPSIVDVFGPVPNTWHPAPFCEELPSLLLNAIGRPGIVVLDPFGGSMTTCKVAVGMGYDAIGVDINEEYIKQATSENRW
jgi:DNA modification methylase/ParB-like chromosome segregation protein Spo0J